MIRIAPGLFLDEREVTFSFIRASGPGGQHVNKACTAVQLKFDIARSRSLPEPVRQRLLALAGRRASGAGVLTLTAQRHRSQESNRRDALGRLAALIREAARPVRRRIATQPTPAARERRLQAKRRRGEIKRLRGRPDFA
ncbi:MAG TPA: alternative ribosome rescue aminoacyl-tRNA hydrolase ArfB [Burkholderiales bacterium]|nr:alternative ribosome rescue aminoacyl-tRNA hydrolase ArfB [Burkholderiales bacterium]